MGLDRVARGTGSGCHDGSVGAEEGVEERGLAHVGGTGQDDESAGSEPFPGGGGRQKARHLLLQFGHPDRDPGRRDRAIVLLGKVDVVPQQRLHVEQGAPELGEPAREAAVELM